jgi:rhodanese-related sulfurtransferase
MSEPLKPRGLALQLALLLSVGALLGFGARAVTEPDFVALTAEPEEASDDEIDDLLAERLEAVGDDTPEGAAADAKAQPDLPIPVPKAVTFETLMASLFGQPGVHFVDARDEPMYEQGHIQGAVPLDADRAANDSTLIPKRLANAAKDDVLVVYCSGGECDLSMKLARQLIAYGYRKVLVFEGGWTEWTEQGGPTATGAWDGSEGI